MAFPLFHPDRSDPVPSEMTLDRFVDEFPGEGQCIEFKRGVSGRQIQDTCVAFSNADGGVLLVGVEDDGTVTGRALDATTEDDIHRALREARDIGRYELRQITVNAHPICVLGVARRREGFAQTSQGVIRVRRGSRDDSLFGPELVRFVNERTPSRYETTTTGLSHQEIDPQLRTEIGRAHGWARTTIDRLGEIGLQGAGQLTVAGTLLLTHNPERHLGKAQLEISRYTDDVTVDYDRREVICGPVHHILRDAVARVLDELGADLVVLGVHRYEIPRLPEIVIREAVANALAHRSYEASGTAVQIELRPASVIIRSPGGLPEPVTVANIREASAARNVNLINVLRRLGLAEDIGRGVDLMQDSMAAEMLDPPRFEDRGHEVVVVLPIHGPVTPSERAWIRELEGRGVLQGPDRIALVHAARGKTLTNSVVREILSTDADSARATLQRLRNEGFLEQTGQRGGARYRLDGSLHPPAGLRLNEDELAGMIEDLAKDGPISNMDVRKVTGLDRTAALRVLAQMVSAGRLERFGERRGTRYRRP